MRGDGFHTDIAFVGFKRFDEVQAHVAEGGVKRGEVEGGKRQEVVGKPGLRGGEDGGGVGEVVDVRGAAFRADIGGDGDAFLRRQGGEVGFDGGLSGSVQSFVVGEVVDDAFDKIQAGDVARDGCFRIHSHQRMGDAPDQQLIQGMQEAGGAFLTIAGGIVKHDGEGAQGLVLPGQVNWPATAGQPFDTVFFAVLFKAQGIAQGFRRVVTGGVVPRPVPAVVHSAADVLQAAGLFAETGSGGATINVSQPVARPAS